MSDDNIEMQGAQETMEAAAFKKAGYNRTVFKIKSFITETVGGAMKGAMIGAAVVVGAIVIGTIMTGGGIGAGIIAAAAYFSKGFATGLLSAVLTFAGVGALTGGALGGLFKGGSAVSNLDEMADDEENRLMLKYQKAQQAEINHQQMQRNQEIAKSNARMGAQGMGVSPAATPQTTLAQNQGFGMGMGGKI